MFKTIKNFFLKQKDLTPKSQYDYAIVSSNTDTRVSRFIPENTFKTYEFIEVYNSVVTSKDWEEEPFHSSFINLLYWLELNSFKIVMEEKKLVLNMRSSNSKKSTFEVQQAVDFHEVVTKMIIQILDYDMKIKPNKDGKLLILATIIFALEKVQYLDFKCDEIIDYFFNNFSKEEIFSMQEYYFYDLEEIFDQIMRNAKKESVTSDLNKINSVHQEMVKRLSQKRLFKLKYL